VSDLTAILAVLIGLYALTTGVFLISENRRPQATFAWMLAFLLAPGIGLGIYFLFGRDRKAFSRQSKLVQHELEPRAQPLLAPILSRQDEEIAALEKAGLGHQRLMMLVRHNSRSVLVRAGEVAIQQDGAAFYPSLVEDMKAARHSIHHQYFIWAADAFTETLKEIMIAKAAAGVAVRILYDPLGSRAHLNKAYLDELRAAGVSVAPTSPLARLHTISYRNHRKITVIDGRIGYTGGMNIGQDQLDGGEGFTSWRDTQVRIVGDAAAILQAVFMVDWYNAVQENLFASTYFPAAPADGSVPVQILTSGPDSDWAAIRQLYSYMIGSARRRVYIQSPFFIPDATIAEALRVAALAGVDVRLMVSARASGNPLPEWAGYTYFGDVMAAGVRVYLYEKGYLHAKTIAVDSEVCSVGSANIDIRSFSINYELNAVLYSEELTRELEEAFERDLEHSREFDMAEYEARNPLRRFRDSAARLLSPLL
jgi:cardiolipin synthase A/B